MLFSQSFTFSGKLTGNLLLKQGGIVGDYQCWPIRGDPEAGIKPPPFLPKRVRFEETSLKSLSFDYSAARRTCQLRWN
jgi:hypothetical protein